MKCKQCHVDLGDNEYRMVADWPFCNKCFQKLMDKSASAVETDSDGLVKQGEQDKIGEQLFLCEICRQEGREDESKSLLGLKLCRQCYRNLIERPVIPKGDASERKDDDLTTPRVEQKRVDVKKTVKCTSCGRMIPALGVKIFKNRKYCPDCYYSLPEVKAEEVVYFPSDNGK